MWHIIINLSLLVYKKLKGFVMLCISFILLLYFIIWLILIQAMLNFFFCLFVNSWTQRTNKATRMYLFEFVQLVQVSENLLTLSFYKKVGLNLADSLYSQDLRVGGAALHLPPLPGGAHPPLRVPLLLRPLLCCGGQWLGQLMGNLCRPVIPTHTGDIFLTSFSFRNLFYI